ncbi:Dynein regulatory complex subunit 2 [Chionoecetes opilio]|uniref:Dynein regulatory complex subunit 2 n=1 Tax=Chionoecetes opilio TaxID=41210 RepID=A0A8J4YEC0_CHIOP|nr:Dynein regulatory complex subunit 2 [Chionoecetes opilio]
MAPKKKGKGKGDKLARMTVEQRQQYLDRRTAQEAESARRKEELLAGFLKLKLADERKKGEVNEARLLTKWREVLREAKTSSLTTQLQELREGVAEGTTRHNTLIQLLRSQVAQAHHQRAQAAHNHLASTHKLSELHEEHVSVLTQYLRGREADMCGTAAASTEHLAASHLHHLRRLSLVRLASQRNHDLSEKEQLAAFHTTLTQITTQLEEEVAAARVERESQLERAWGQLGASVRQHQADTCHLRATCHRLQRRVSAHRSTLNTVTTSTKDMQSEVDVLRKKLRQERTPTMAEKELQRLRKSVGVVRAATGGQRVAGRTLMKAINARGDHAAKRVKDILREGQGVLELATVCQRLETNRDRNLPFLPPPTAPPPDTSSRLSPQPSVPSVDLLALPPPRPAPQETEALVGIHSETDEGLGSSVYSSKGASSSRSSKGASSTRQTQRPATGSQKTRKTPKGMVEEPVESDEGVEGQVEPEKSSTLSLPRLHSSSSTSSTSTSTPAAPPPHPSGQRASLGHEKLERINELLYHEEATQDVEFGPIPDFVLQEADAALRTHEGLRNFWRKYHQVQLERLALRGEAEALREEGRHLRALLKQYFVSLGMSDAALRLPSSTPLCVVSLPPAGPDQQRRSKSVPVRSLGVSFYSASLRSSPLPPAGVLVQEGSVLVRAMALHHSTPRHTNPAPH